MEFGTSHKTSRNLKLSALLMFLSTCAEHLRILRRTLTRDDGALSSLARDDWAL
jgi:hypothetical protein